MAHVPGYARAKALRRRLGASGQLFSPIEFNPRSPKQLRLVIELRRIEAALAGLAGSNATVLEKRHKAITS
jgi:hypothetical protein